jgi:glycosyl hydrolase family 26
MKRDHAARGRRLTASLAGASVVAIIFSVLLATQSDGVSALRSSAQAQVARHDTSTTTSTSQTSTTGPASAGLITAGPSRSECLTPDFNDTGFPALESVVNGFDTLTNSTVTCVSAYLDSSKTWTDWETPWITNPSYGYTSWVAVAPQSRQLVLAIQLIPSDIANVNDPLKWEQACAAGAFNKYARHLGATLVAAGLQNSVIRLGSEMNGVWETDFIGTTKVEQRLWAKCFSQEVDSLRAVSGGHFLIDWNVNACIGDYAYANYYPGNAYVDIVGLDLYDVDCRIPFTRISFSALASERLGLNHFEGFAASKGKPMSLPEWGLSTIPAGDDPAYIDGIGAAVEKGDYAFQTYFDGGGGPKSKSLPLSSRTPLSSAAYAKWFGNGPK